MTGERSRRERTAPSRPMNGWRLEWLRLVRSARGISLLGVYVAYGLLGPVLARYAAQIFEHMQSDSGITVTVTRPPLPKDGMITFVNQVGQIGLAVTVVVAAGALSFDSRAGMSTFFRTRARNMWGLVVPRAAVPALAAIAAFAAGTVAAWYETAVLIGPLPAGTVLEGFVLEALFLAFTVAVVAAASSVARGTLGTVGVALATLLLLPVLGLVGPLHDWVPTTLMSAPVDLLNGAGMARYVPAVVVVGALTPLLLAGGVARLRRRDC